MFDRAFHEIPLLLPLPLPLRSHNSYKIYCATRSAVPPATIYLHFYRVARFTRARVFARGSGTKRIRARRREKVELVSCARGRKYFRTSVDGIVCREEARRGCSPCLKFLVHTVGMV